MTLRHCIFPAAGIRVDFRAVFVAVLLFSTSLLYRKLKKKNLSPIWLIALSALLGILIC